MPLGIHHAGFIQTRGLSWAYGCDSWVPPARSQAHATFWSGLADGSCWIAAFSKVDPRAKLAIAGLSPLTQPPSMQSS